MEETRICSKCGEEKPITAFNKNRGKCKSCKNQRYKELYMIPEIREKRRVSWNRYYAKHREEASKKQSERQRNGLVCCVTHGMTPDEHDSLFIKQDGRCAICDVDQCELGYPLYIDHDHESGKIRGLLCSNCNFTLGFSHDNPEILRLAADYLEKH